MRCFKKVVFSFRNLLQYIDDLEQTTAYENLCLENIIAMLIDAFVYETLYGFDAATFIVDNMISEEFGLLDDVDYRMDNGETLSEIYAHLNDMQAAVSGEIINMYKGVKDYIDHILYLDKYTYGGKNIQLYIGDISISDNLKTVNVVIDFSMDIPCLSKR